jgi:large subunit ribosomal protein L10
MNRDQKAAVIEDVAREIGSADAVFAIDYRGISVKQSAELRGRLGGADATFRIVKNRLTARAVDQAEAETLKPLLEGPTALTFVHGDAALAAKELAAFRREHGLLIFKGGTMDGDDLTADDIEAISRLPGRDALYGQLVGMAASPLNGLVRGLAGLLSDLASQLHQIQEQGLVGGGEEAGEADAPADAGATEDDSPDADAAEEAPADDGAADEGAAEEAPELPAEAPGDPVSEAAAAEEESVGSDEAAAESGDEDESGAEAKTETAAESETGKPK